MLFFRNLLNARKRNKNRNRDVIIKRYYLFNTDGYYYKKSLNLFFMWILIIVIAITVSSVIIINQISTNEARKDPDYVRAETEERASKAEVDRLNKESEAISARKAKEQYVNSCKDAGKSPSDMGDNSTYWECM